MNIFICILFLSFASLAKEKSIVNIDYNHSYTSDEIILNTIHVSYRKHRRNLLWNFKQSEEKVFDLGFDAKYFTGETLDFDLKGVRIAGIIGYKFSKKNLLELEAGIHSLEHRTTIIPWNIRYIHKQTLFYGVSSLGYDLVYQDLLLPGGFTNKLKATNINTAQTLTPKDYIRIPLSLNLKILNDQNINKNFGADIFIGKSYPVWMWIGAGAQLLNNSLTTTNYWSPEKYKGFGIRFEISYPIIEKMNLGWNVNINRSQEDHNAWGYSIRNVFNVKYGDRNDWQVTATWINLNSVHGTGRWTQTDLGLSAHKSF